MTAEKSGAGTTVSFSFVALCSYMYSAPIRKADHPRRKIMRLLVISMHNEVLTCALAAHCQCLRIAAWACSQFVR
jgi:hypothetical protein